MVESQKSRGSARWAQWVFIAGLLLFAVVVFRSVAWPGRILFTTDDNVGAMAMRKSALPGAFFGWWDESVLMGIPQILMVNWTNLLLWLLPAGFFTTWIHAIDLLVASVFLLLYFRSRRLPLWACAVGVLSGLWVGTNFTLTYAGHIGKFGVLLFAAAALWLIEMAAQRRRIAWAILAGGAIGGMFLEQADVALFMSMALVPYAAYAVWREDGFAWRRFALLLAPLCVMAGLIAFRPVWTGYRTSVQNIASVQQEDGKAKWDFATQWSWPPEESIDFIAPGFTGWRSGEADGPYWGRMGRSKDWEKTHVGFMNFKLENVYIGAIPFALAVWACFAAWQLRKRGERGSYDALFWGIAAIVALLLAFGKNFILYPILYLLPGISAIRNPNKFLHIFQLALGILAAFGCDTITGFGRLFESYGRVRKQAFWTLCGLAAVGGIMVLAGMVLGGSFTTQAGELARMGWGMTADAIVRNRLIALIHGGVLLAGGAVALYLLAFGKAQEGWKSQLPWMLVGIMVVDALLLARHYVEAMPKSLIEENEVVQVLKKNLRYQRISVLNSGQPDEAFYNNWLTYLFPYQGIDAVNVTQMPRMPQDYQAFLGVMQRQPPRMWALSAVGCILGPSTLWTQISDDPNLKDSFKLIYAYNTAVAEDGGTKVVRGTETQRGRYCIIKPDPDPLRFALVDAWQVATDMEALNLLSKPDWPVAGKVLVSPDTAGNLASSSGSGSVSDVAIQSYRAGDYSVQVSTDRPAILRVATKFDPDWKAYIEGEQVPILRCDYLFQGVFIKPGLRIVHLKYQPALATLWVQLGASMVCILAAAWLVFVKPRAV
ncbi:MAG TPA: hypothetical protein PLE77_13010 [Kiritimatiellia bacterium]|nr:hypothetical protein [Kiritimatiellia bacterium]